MLNLKESQRVAYQSLNNALKLQKVSHCFLFEGPKTAAKLEMAYVLASAIILESDCLDIVDNVIYERISNHQYLDLCFIDGSENVIKKEQIEAMFEKFNKTGLELAAKKVYIINNINNASTKVLNMLLKFMEEPNSNDVVGILISDEADNLLPTIRSRTLNVLFVQDGQQEIVAKYLKKDFDLSAANDITKIINRYDDNITVDMYRFSQHLKALCIENIRHFETFIFEIQNNIYPSLKDYERHHIIKIILLFIDMLLWELKNNSQFNLDKYLKLSEILIDAKEKFNNRFDYKLAFDELVYNLYKEL